MVTASAAVITEVVERTNPRVRAIRAGLTFAAVLVILFILPFLKFIAPPAISQNLTWLKIPIYIALSTPIDYQSLN
jgi:MFS-type transporter involved in bile tolerance (Atg22 family)